MSNTYINQTDHVVPATTANRALSKIGVTSGIVAAAATAVIAAVARAADVTLKIKDKSIPIAGFAVLTFIGAMLGLGLATVLRRRARRPRKTFVRTTAMLTVLSMFPDAFADTDTASRIILAATHLVAAAIIVPSIASRLAR